MLKDLVILKLNKEIWFRNFYFVKIIDEKIKEDIIVVLGWWKNF